MGQEGVWCEKEAAPKITSEWDFVSRKQWRQLSQIIPVGRRMGTWCSKAEGKDVLDKEHLSVESGHLAAQSTECSVFQKEHC